MHHVRLLAVLLCFLLPLSAMRAATVTGIIKSKETGLGLEHAAVSAGGRGAVSGSDGRFILDQLAAGDYWLQVSRTGFRKDSLHFTITGDNDHLELGDIFLLPGLQQLPDTIHISGYRPARPVSRMSDVENGVIYAARKNDVVQLQQMDANLSVNNVRQAFSRVPGLTAWENDGTGTGISIATRGLSPNRSWEFNVRQNGYDIASDPNGYPEAYFAPPMEALERIEVVRGAASLQFGPQLGGMLNYRYRRGSDKPFSADASITGGSYGLGAGFGSVGGTKGRLNYFGCYNYRRADGWRENSGYFTNTGYAALEYRPVEKLTLAFQFTGMNYILQQPGGLTDSMFAADPRASHRERNWFNVRWNMPAFKADYKFSENLFTSLSVFGLIGERNSVGYTGAANTADPGNTQRTVDRDYYKNAGAEWRTSWRMGKARRFRSTLAGGLRFYKGHTDRKQGKGTGGAGAEFIFADPEALTRDLDLDAVNLAVFAEDMIEIGEKLKLVPGFRMENIVTSASGKPAAQSETRTQQFALFGAGAQYQLHRNVQFYANWAQSFRPVTFNELWTTNAALVIDPDIAPTHGWNSDAGLRGNLANVLHYDLSVFYLVVEGRVGDITLQDENGNDFLFRTNTGNSLHHGVEAYADFHPLQLFGCDGKAGDFGLFGSAGYLEAYYTAGSAKDKRVEYAPRWTVRSGLSWQYKSFSTTFTWTYADGVFSDAKNTVHSANANSGWIPSYNVLDWSCTIRLPKNFSVKASLNNLADHRYFTRRASGYPGPGIIPAEGRTALLTLGMKF